MVSRVSLKIGQFSLLGYSLSTLCFLPECVLPINCIFRSNLRDSLCKQTELLDGGYPPLGSLI